MGFNDRVTRVKLRYYLLSNKQKELERNQAVIHLNPLILQKRELRPRGVKGLVYDYSAKLKLKSRPPASELTALFNTLH